MKKREVDHVLRAAGRITGEKQFIIIGSQALHGKYPDLADEIVKSVEVDLLATKNPTRTDWLNSIGVYSPFHESFGYYVDPVDDKTATLPKGWKNRLVNLPTGDTDGVRGLCLEPHDLAVAKYVASREKDLIFTRELVQRGLLSQDRLLSLLDQTPIDDAQRQRIRGQIEKDFAATIVPDRVRESDEPVAPSGEGREPQADDERLSRAGTASGEIEQSQRRGRENWLKTRKQQLESGAPTLEEIRAQGRKDWLKLRQQQRQGSLSSKDDTTCSDRAADLERDEPDTD